MLETETAAPATDGFLWSALAARARAGTGAWIYAVTSTGIYCRFGCPSPLPRRENVRFFTDAAGAQRAGFRPCRRCRP